MKELKLPAMSGASLCFSGLAEWGCSFFQRCFTGSSRFTRSSKLWMAGAIG